MRGVINTTPLISLAIINKLALLDELFGEIYIPEFVFKEATKKGKNGAKAIATWGENKISPVTDTRQAVTEYKILRFV